MARIAKGGSVPKREIDLLRELVGIIKKESDLAI